MTIETNSFGKYSLLMYIPWYKRSMRPRAYKLTAGLMSNCLQTDVNDHPAISGFLDLNYHYKSVATKIPHNAGLALTPYTGEKFLPHWGLNQCKYSLYLVKLKRGIKSLV